MCIIHCAAWAAAPFPYPGSLYLALAHTGGLATQAFRLGFFAGFGQHEERLRVFSDKLAQHTADYVLCPTCFVPQSQGRTAHLLE